MCIYCNVLFSIPATAVVMMELLKPQDQISRDVQVDRLTVRHPAGSAVGMELLRLADLII